MLVLLLVYIIFRCLPPSQEEVDKSAVTIRQEAYYTLEADGKPLAYFADYVDSAFVGGSVDSYTLYDATWLLGEPTARSAFLSWTYPHSLGL